MTKTNKTSSIMTILAITSILILAPTMSSNAFATSHLTYADSVIESDIKHSISSRNTPSEALFEENSGPEVNFVSLGSGGFITLGFSEPVGGTLSVFEATFGGWALETALVEVFDGTTWIEVGTADNNRGSGNNPNTNPLVESQFPLEDIGCITMVRLTDTSPVPDGTDNRAAPDYFDVDAVGITGDVDCVVPPLECETYTFELIAGQHIDAGDISVTNDADNLTITITTQDGWSISETHVSVQDSEDDIPQNKKGNPIPGHFEYSETHDPNVESYEIVIPLDDLPINDGTLTIAVHAVVQQVVGGEVIAEETAWGEGPRFVDKGNWAMYFEYEIQDDCGVVPPQEVDLEGQFRTQTQGGWGNGAQGNNPGAYRDTCFDNIYPVVIGNEPEFSATFTTSGAVEGFLPSGGSPSALTQDYTIPTDVVPGNTLAGNTLALSLSVGFDNYADANSGDEICGLEAWLPQNDEERQAGDVTLAELELDCGANIMTVQQVLDTANLVLSGDSTTGFTPSSINSCVDTINNNFVDGENDSGNLSLP